MTATGVPAVASPPADEAASDSSALGAPDRAVAAWLCAIPCLALVAAAAYVLGPPLGRAFLAPSTSGYTFTPDFGRVVRPEPTEHARFLIALTLPVLIALATVEAQRWLPRLPRRGAASAVVAVQALLAALLVACYVAQTRLVFGGVYIQEPQVPFKLRYFTAATLVVAALLAGAALLVLSRTRLRAAAATLLHDSRTRRRVAVAVAFAATAVWMLHTVYTDGAIASAPEDVRFHISFPLDETFAVLNGMTPLVNFSAQYGSLWPFVVSLPMLAFGKTLLVFSLAMSALTGLALLSIFGVLRRAARSSVAALLLYLPFLATSLFLIAKPLDNRSTVGTFYGTFPLRYAVPYFLALLTARHIERGGRARATFLLFAIGGLGILNNGDFGVAAVGASAAALIWTRTERPQLSVRRLALTAAAGLLTAYALVSLLTLIRAGSMPQLGRLTDYARLFTVAGFAMMPIPSLLGVHLVIYLTYVAAIAVATVRALRGATNRVLTGMLAWAGIFGLGSASYYIGRSHPVALKTTFSVWALTLALLTIVVVRQLAAHPPRRPAIAAVAVLFGIGVCACSLAQTPMPWTQLHRLNAAFVPNAESPSPRPLAPSTDPRTRFFVASLSSGLDHYVYRRGAPVAILLRTGHRIADAYGVRNVSAYTGIDSTPTVQRVEAVLDALDAAGGNTVILPTEIDFGIMRILERRGFMMVTPHGLSHFPYDLPHSGATILRWPYGRIFKWVDTRHLHPRALR